MIVDLSVVVHRFVVGLWSSPPPAGVARDLPGPDRRKLLAQRIHRVGELCEHNRLARAAVGLGLPEPLLQILDERAEFGIVAGSGVQRVQEVGELVDLRRRHAEHVRRRRVGGVVVEEPLQPIGDVAEGAAVVVVEEGGEVEQFTLPGGEVVSAAFQRPGDRMEGRGETPAVDGENEPERAGLPVPGDCGGLHGGVLPFDPCLDPVVQLLLRLIKGDAEVTDLAAWDDDVGGDHAAVEVRAEQMAGVAVHQRPHGGVLPQPRVEPTLFGRIELPVRLR